jgi:hypothetical protein
MSTACSTNGEKRNADTLLVGNPERTRTLVGRRRRWTDPGEIERGGTGWIELAQGREPVEASCQHGNVDKFFGRCTTDGLHTPWS